MSVYESRVLVVDGDERFLATTTRALRRHGIWCLGVTSGAAARVALGADHDIVVAMCDVGLQDPSGLDLAWGLGSTRRDLAVVVTSTIDDPAAAELAFAIGAFGYLLKPFSGNELLVCLTGALHRRAHEIAHRRRVHELEDTIGRLRGEAVAGVDVAPIGPATPTDGKVGAELTPREFDVLGLLVGGLTNKAIARELGLRLNTVRNHVQNILYKLHAHSKLEAVATAVRENVIAYPAGRARLSVA
jgi:DNA-binding NarL/FixJ family response regulator